MNDATASSSVEAAIGHRDRIVAAAISLLSEGGRAAVSTRAVSAEAGVQAPTIYRIFGDKQGLLDAVAAHAFAAHLKAHTDLVPTADPVADLRAGWDAHVGFGLENPSLYSLIYGEPRPGQGSPPAAVAALEILAGHVHRIAEAGRLRVDEVHAARLLHAAGTGTTLCLIGIADYRTDMVLSTMAREAVIAAITTDVPAAHEPGVLGAAVTLRAVLSEASVLSVRERGLLQEWLDRITEPSAGGSPEA